MVPDFVGEQYSRRLGVGKPSAAGFFDLGGLIPHFSRADSRRFAALASEPDALLGVQDATAYLGGATAQTTAVKTLAEIEAEIVRLSEHIAASGNACPMFGYSVDFVHPHIKIEGGQYHYVAVGWGTEVPRKPTSDLGKLLYWISDSVTFSMACAYESEHRIPGQDFRRLMFSKRVELLASIGPDMGRRGREQIVETLRDAPFNDDRA